LREAIAGYVTSLHPAVDSARIAVTSSGVSALMLAMQALVGAGDEVVAVVPVWPNLTAQPAILGAHVTRFPLRPAPGRRMASRSRGAEARRHRSQRVFSSSIRPTTRPAGR
jgi:aspartate/methionine/tyrosine aminotransferase